MKEFAKKPVVTFIILFCFFSMNSLNAQTIAFPGAEGAGKYTIGGRGGDVYIVTNLNDDGTGSFRNGIATINGPRTIVFNVAGTIELKSPISISNVSNLTIAGQTAPGKGITFKDWNFNVSNSKHLIFRYFRIRVGDDNKPVPSGPDCISIIECENFVLDHISLSWGIDGNGDLYEPRFGTIQWCIFSEALHESIHEKGPHAMCTSMRYAKDQTTLHHNIYASSRDRHPSTDGGTNVFEFCNNTDYNYSGGHNLAGSQINLLGNYYKAGPETGDDKKPINFKSGWADPPSHGYFSGNHFDVGSNSSAFNADNYLAMDYHEEYDRDGNYQPTTREIFESFTKFDAGIYALENIESGEVAYQSCLDYSGCSMERDAVDVRFINTIINNTGKLIDSQDEVGGWDNYSPEDRASGWDTDEDGMPDTWETANGLNPNNPEDRNNDRNKDGYTNLEEYLYSLTYMHIDTKPVINIISPEPNDVFTTNNIAVEAYSNDFNGGSVQNMQLYFDGQLIVSGPEIDTTINNVSNGAHQVVIEATDNSGKVTTKTTTVYVGTKVCKITVNDPENGTIIIDPPGGQYCDGIDVTITANPDINYIFDGWTGSIQSDVNPLVITTTSDITLATSFNVDPDVLASLDYSEIKINFQPPASEIPEGFIPDTGKEYGMRDNGFVFGWIGGGDNLDYRDKPGDDPVLRTLNHFNKSGDYSWGIAVPNGIYSVDVGVGDGGYTGTYSINVEGIDNIDPDGDVDHYEQYYMESVLVEDGQLTLTRIGGTKINYIIISKIDVTGIVQNLKENKSINCYPNPADSSFSIELKGIENSDIKIYNMMGQLVYEERSMERIHRINNHGLSPGSYLVEVAGIGNEIYNQKIIIE